MTPPPIPEAGQGPEAVEIVTLADIIEKVPPSSLDNFLIDLKGYITCGYTAKEFSNGPLRDHVRAKVGPLHWIDDGKNEATVHVQHQAFDSFDAHP